MTSAHPPAVETTAARLMTALALHPDTHATLLDGLLDAYEAGRADTAAGTEPLTAWSNAVAAGWDNPLPAPAPFRLQDRVLIQPDPAMPDDLARRLAGATGTLASLVLTLRPEPRVWRVQLDGDTDETVQVREDALRHQHDGSAER